MKPPAYYRARIDLFRHLQATASKQAENALNLALVRSGVFPPGGSDEQETIAEYLRQNQYPDTPLSFTELCTYNTWFQIHPDKVCGTEKITTSREFPVTIRGDRQTIEDTIGRFLPQQKTVPGTVSAGSLELEALALEVELQLLEL